MNYNKELQSKHDLNRIIYMNTKTYNMKLNKQELNLIYNCLEDCMNSDTWESYQEPISGTLAKIKQMANNAK